MQDGIYAYDNATVTTTDIVSASINNKKRTGETIARITYANGQTFIRKQSSSGLDEQIKITPPPITSKEERNQIIRELNRKNYTQVEIADIVGISQSTVSNILRSKRE